MEWKRKSCIFFTIALLFISTIAASAASPQAAEDDPVTMSSEGSDTAATEPKEKRDESLRGMEQLKKKVDLIEKRLERASERLGRGEDRSSFTLEKKVPRPIVQDLVEHEPIRIDNDTDLSERADQENWTGNGTSEDPYVIEEYEIDAGGYGHGIYMGNVTDHFVVKDCVIYNSSENTTDGSENGGLYLNNTVNGRIENNTIFESDHGIYLKYSDGNSLVENTVSKNSCGIYLNSSEANVIERNHAVRNNRTGMNLTVSNGNDIVNNTVSNNTVGIQIWESSGSRIIKNHVIDNEARGISLDTELLSFTTAEDNEILDNEISRSNHGIHLGPSSNDNIITNNSVSESRFGIYIGLPLDMVPIEIPYQGSSISIPLISPRDNIVTDNEIVNDLFNPYSIAFLFSESNFVDNNTMKDGGIMLRGISQAEWSSHTITLNNTVNGRPVRYWKNREGGAVPKGSGQIILANCTGVEIKGHDLDQGSVGMQLGFSDNNSITHNTISGAFQGLDLASSSGNIVKRNTFTMNLLYPLSVVLGFNNRIYHNNFITNLGEPMDLGTGQWTDGYPSGGNYWSGYEGVDEYHGPEQDQIGSDGIGDDPYEAETFTDDHPLTKPVPTPHVRIDNPEDGDFISKTSITANWTGMYRFTDTLWYEVKLDDRGWKDVEQDTEYELNDLEEGVHDLSVRVKDGDGNSFVNTNSFTVDITEPSVEIISPEDGKTFGREDLTLEWNGSDELSGIDHYEVVLDGGSVYEGENESCNISGLEDGSHTVEVWAHDKAGNSGAEHVDFSIDTAPPDLRIKTPKEGDVLGDDSVTVEWDAEDTVSEIDHYEVRIQGEMWKDIGLGTSYEFTDLDDGKHTIEVRAVDGGENIATEDLTFEVDTVPPEVEILKPREDGSLAGDTVNVEWSGNDARSAISFYEVRIEEEWIEVGADTSYTLENVEDGLKRLEVRAWDEAGNSRTDSVNFTLDDTPPTVNILFPEQGEMIHSSSVEIEWDGTDELSGVDHYEVKTDEKGWIEVGDSENYTFDGLKDGLTTLKVRAVDSVGNNGEASLDVFVDLPESYTITVGPVRDAKGDDVDDVIVILSWKAKEKKLERGEDGRYDFNAELLDDPEDVEFEYEIMDERLEEPVTGIFSGTESGEVVLGQLGRDQLTYLFTAAVASATVVVLLAAFKKRKS
ncbi:MAG: NosD domain-containing protein [Candidatus Natronoplasma sp.]